MILSSKMRPTKSLIVVVLLVFYIQNIECQTVDSEQKSAEIKTYPLVPQERDLRGLRDVWDQVKNSAITSWNFLKRVAQNTRANMLKWVNNAREYAVKVEKSFEEQLQVLQKRLQDIIADLLGTGKLVKECLKAEGSNIKDTLKAIFKKMSECVSNQIKPLTQIRGKHAKITVNDTLFMTGLNNKLDACETDKPDYEDCLYTVRELVYDEIEELDNHIQKTSLESRSLADDIRNTLASCSLQYLADASAYLTSEIMQVAKCVLDSKGINKSILE